MRVRSALKAKIHENNFVAKNPDSEFSRRVLFAPAAYAIRLLHRSSAFQAMKETCAYQRLFEFRVARGDQERRALPLRSQSMMMF